MARRRFLSEAFWESPTATRITAGARLFLLGCWTAADDEGLLRWDAEEFKERFFPADSKVTVAHVTNWMSEVVSQRIALPYRGPGGGVYAYLVGFERDQKVSRPTASTLPPPRLSAQSTFAAYALRDGRVCSRCAQPIAETTGTPADRDLIRAGLDGVVVAPADGSDPYPSRVAIAHARCLRAAAPEEADSASAPTQPETPAVAPPAAKSPATDPASPPAADLVPVTEASPADLSTPDALLPTAGIPEEDKSMDEAQESLFVVPQDMVKAPETKKKRATPATWTSERKQVAHDILKPWWATHGNGWPQTYGVVFGVVIAALSNNVPADDISKALNVLGPERKPISGGTIGFALSHPSKKVREEQAFEQRAAARNPDKYKQRTL